MNKYKHLLLFLLLTNIIYGQVQLVKKWDKRFGGIRENQLYSILEALNGDIILAGSSNSERSGDKSQNSHSTLNDFWIIRIDSLGNKLWDKTIGGTGADNFSCIKQTNDGGFILGGYSNSEISGDKTQSNWSVDIPDYWVIKTDSLGNKIWDRRFGGIDADVLTSISICQDGGYLLGGFSESQISGDKTQTSQGMADYWIVKIDSSGNKLWDRRYGGDWLDELSCILPLQNGGYLLGGCSLSGLNGDKSEDSQGRYDYWIIKIDSLGNKLWDKSYGGKADERDLLISPSKDGGYLLGGRSYSDVSGNKTQPLWKNNPDYWIVIIDSNGNQIWDKDYGGFLEEDIFGSLVQTSDNGYLIAGTSYSNKDGDKSENNLSVEQTWVLKIDSLGNKQWDKTLFTTISDHQEDGYAIQTKDGCYLMGNSSIAGIGGYKTQTLRGSIDYWVVKFCEESKVTKAENNLNDNIISSIYPNPFSIDLLVKSNDFEQKEMILYDFTSKKLLQQSFTNSISLNADHLASGIYFYEVRNKNGLIKNGKVIKD